MYKQGDRVLTPLGKGTVRVRYCEAGETYLGVLLDDGQYVDDIPVYYVESLECCE